LSDAERTGAYFMNKGQLIDAVASELGASKVAAGKAMANPSRSKPPARSTSR
jgi:hypothetical protein